MAIDQAFSSTSIGIADQNSQKVVDLLNNLLCDEFVLYTKTRNYHWNVVGTQFNDLHNFFEEQYVKLNKIVDEVAERARTLGGAATGTLNEFMGQTRLEEHPGEYPKARQMIMNLLTDHEAMVRQLRQDQEACETQFGDMGTNDFLIDLMKSHEKMAWMLRSYLEGEPI